MSRDRSNNLTQCYLAADNKKTYTGYCLYQRLSCFSLYNPTSDFSLKTNFTDKADSKSVVAEVFGLSNVGIKLIPGTIVVGILEEIGIF